MTVLIQCNDQVFRVLTRAANTVLEGAEFWRDSAFVGDKPVQRKLVKPKDNRFSITFEVNEFGIVKPVNVGFDVESIGLQYPTRHHHCVSAESFIKSTDN